MDRIIKKHDVSKVVVAITERRGEYPVAEMLALRVAESRSSNGPYFSRNFPEGSRSTASHHPFHLQ